MKCRLKMISKLFIKSLVFILFFQCDTSDVCMNQKYILDYNSKRKALGIPLFSNSLVHKNSMNINDSTILCNWVNEDFFDELSTQFSMYAKDLIYLNGDLIEENTKYRNLNQEILIIGYEYYSTDKWKSYFSGDKGEGWISIDSANSILNMYNY